MERTFIKSRLPFALTFNDSIDLGSFFIFIRGFIDSFSRRATGFHCCVKPFELNFFIKACLQGGRVTLTSGLTLAGG